MNSVHSLFPASLFPNFHVFVMVVMDSGKRGEHGRNDHEGKSFCLASKGF